MKVWHNLRTFSPERDLPAIFPEHFSLVADVATDHPGEAYELTNTIYGPWWDNERVTTTAVSRHGARSTSVGDVIEREDGTLLLVKMVGFGEVVDKIVEWRDTF
jgi:hypothetical protein